MDTVAAAPLKPLATSSNNTDGDHDSGVDETTQRKDGPTTNGDLGSPLKSPSKIPAPKRLSMPSPTKSTKASPKTPEAPATAEKKKVPMNKIQVGAAPSPNLKTVKSKIGSLQNTTHKPGGGNVKIENRRLDWKAEPRIAAKNDTYQPGGGDKKITQVKLQWQAKPKVGSLDNATHKPGGGEKKIESNKLDFKDKAKPKVGSKDNIKHAPGGGNVKIEEHKIEVKVQSKIGSLDNVKHRPGGGDKKIFDDKEYLRQMSGTTSKAGSEGIPSGTQGAGSGNSSRRTSRERKSSRELRTRSESRMGRCTPESREEHCSLRERHEQQLLTREDKDLNSNHTNSGSQSETKDGEQRQHRVNITGTASANIPDGLERKDEVSLQAIEESQSESAVSVVPQVETKEIVNNNTDILKPHTESSNQIEQTPKTSTATIENKNSQNENITKDIKENIPKTESKEDKVEEIKEIDSKEAENDKKQNK